MERYDSYKDSGIEWLGEIPSHWKVQRAKTIFNRHKRAVRPTDEVVTCFRDGQVTLRSNRRTEGFTNALKEFGYQGVRKGDLVVHQMDAFAGSIGVSDSDGKSTPVYSVCTTRNPQHSEMYYAYLLRTMAQKKYIESLSRGIRERSTAFGYDVMGELWLPIPTPDEQMTIVDYINKETAKIDEAIAQQQRMIDLLNERKQIIITHAVTRGLNSDVPLRDSGIDWLGQIPTHWKVMRVKYLLKEENIRSLNGKEEPLSMSQIYGLIPTKDMEVVPNLASSYIGAKIVKPGNLVFNKLKAHLGVFNVSNYEGLVSPDYAVYSALENSNVKFLEYVFKTNKCIGEFIKLITGVGAGLSRLYTPDLFSIYVALPPLEEQEEIMQYIDTQTSNIRSAIFQRQELISFLQERKRIIINEVVTGKVKIS